MKTIIITIGGNSGNIVLDAADEIPEDFKVYRYDPYFPDVFLRFDGSELISEYGELLLHDGMKQIALRIWREIAKYL